MGWILCFISFRTIEGSVERKWRRPLTGFLEHCFRLKWSTSFIFFFSQAKIKLHLYFGYYFDFENISWFTQKEWHGRKLQYLLDGVTQFNGVIKSLRIFTQWIYVITSSYFEKRSTYPFRYLMWINSIHNTFILLK